MISKTSIDHLVYVVKDLHEGIEILEQKLGVAPVYGGRHETFGTHNALVGLGQNCYLEILAPDPANTSVEKPRWMGVDLTSEPVLARWAIVSGNIKKHASLLEKVNPEMGQIKPGMRKRADGSILKWQLSVPLPTPVIEIIPFIIDWQGSVHPAENLDNVCSVHSFELEHPNPDHCQFLFKDLSIDLEIQKGNSPLIRARLQTPNGIVEI